jgi:hypothetical protein
MHKTEAAWYKMDLDRYSNMPTEQKEKIMTQIDDLEKKYIKQLTRMRKLKEFFKDVERKKNNNKVEKEIK